MTVEYFGNELILKDLKKLKKTRPSIETDLNEHFWDFRERYMLYENTSDDRVYFDENGVRGYEMKVSIKSGNLSKQNGARLWYLLIPDGYRLLFLPAILFDCREEKSFPKRICLQILKTRLGKYYENL